MTKQDKIKHAQTSIAKEWACAEDCFIKSENIILGTDKSFFEIISFGYNAVIRADEDIIDWCIENFSNTPASRILDGENLYLIETKLREHDKKLCGEHTRFLHLEPDCRIEKPFGFTFEWFEKDRIGSLYADKRFCNALSYNDKDEILALVAKKNNEIVSIVTVDDCNYGLWQIGIDTISPYRGKGIASYLVKEIALESEKRGQVPFYTTWIPNIASVRTAIRAGFLPVWTGYYSEDI